MTKKMTAIFHRMWISLLDGWVLV